MTAQLHDLEAIRERVALHVEAGPNLLRLSGDDAHDALLALCPSRLFLRDGQVRESLLLDERGAPLADVLVCADDEEFLLWVEGLDAPGLRAHIDKHLPKSLAPTLQDVGATHAVVSLHGPWAWELVADVFGADMVALPYLNFFRIDEGLCVRAGKTGEYGFHLVVARDAEAEVLAKLRAAGEAFGLREVEAEALALCRFEGWFFDPGFVPQGCTPLELSLRWRLDRSRQGWVGQDALETRRASGVATRLTAMVCAEALAPGQPVMLEGRAIGEVVRSAFSPACGEHIASATIEAAVAHGGITRFTVDTPDGSHAVRTVAPPLLDNRSLYIDPRRHSYRERDEVAFPPLAPPPRAPK